MFRLKLLKTVDGTWLFTASVLNNEVTIAASTSLSAVTEVAAVNSKHAFRSMPIDLIRVDTAAPITDYKNDDGIRRRRIIGGRLLHHILCGEAAGL